MEDPLEALLSRTEASSSRGKLGGWITFRFIIAAIVGLTLTFRGWMSNLIVYLIKEYQVGSIDAAQISNLVHGAGSFVPVFAAIIADSFLGCFSTVWISSLISLLGIILLALTATLDFLRPKPCEFDTNLCTTPPTLQYVVLYTAIILATVGHGGIHSTIATMGANQFDTSKDQDIFFNWFFFFQYGSSVVASTAIVYVEDNVSWKFGFFICVIANLLALLSFLMGSSYYTKFHPESSPFTSLARVIVSSIRNRKVPLPSSPKDFYHGHSLDVHGAPSKSFRFLNHAAVRSEDDIDQLCSVQQVEDLKTLIRILPQWSSEFFVSTIVAVQGSLSVLQALAMDRHVGPSFEIPAGSILVFVMLSTAIFLALLDKFLFPAWRKLTGKPLSPLQRIGVGHVLNFLGMALSALVESKRLKLAKSNPGTDIVPMSVLWLVPPLAFVGMAEAFHFPGKVAFYYQEFPTTLKNMATAMVSVLVGISFYLATLLIDVIRRTTTWLPSNINYGRLDNVYWVLVVGGVFNFGYYIICACFYKYRNLKHEEDTDE